MALSGVRAKRTRTRPGQQGPTPRTPLLPSTCGPPHDVRHIPPHRPWSLTPQACCWRASVAFRLPARSKRRWRITEKTGLRFSEISNDCQRLAHHHRHTARAWLLAHGRAEILRSLQTRSLARVRDTYPWVRRNPIRQRVCCCVRSHPQVLPQGHWAKTLPPRQTASRRPDRRARAVVRRGVRLKCPEATNPKSISIHECRPRGGSPTPVIHPKPMRFVSRHRTKRRNRRASSQTARERALLKLAPSTNCAGETIPCGTPKSPRWWHFGHSALSPGRISRNLPMAGITNALGTIWKNSFVNTSSELKSFLPRKPALAKHSLLPRTALAFSRQPTTPARVTPLT